jgi:hypothetical protein
MRQQILDKVIKLLQSEDVEMVELGKSIFVENKPGYKDYIYINQAVSLLGTSPRDFIDDTYFRISTGIDIGNAGRPMYNKVIKNDNR